MPDNLAETLHEWFPDKGVWPKDATARAFARSIAAEMHSGFRDLRANMPMNKLAPEDLESLVWYLAGLQ